MSNIQKGATIGLRNPHIEDLLAQRPKLGWLELLADNHFRMSPKERSQLLGLRQDYQFSLHCVGMNLGGIDPLSASYISHLKELIELFEPAQISDHVAFTAMSGEHFHDLLPVPYTEEAVMHMACRIKQAQELLGREILVENPSSYVNYDASQMSCADFMVALAQEADCGVLLDLNNLYVNEHNLGESAQEMLDKLPVERIKEVHLAGHMERGSLLLDAHQTTVCDGVWELYEQLLHKLPNIGTVIEWDNEIPDLATLLKEQKYASALQTRHRDKAPWSQGAKPVVTGTKSSDTGSKTSSPREQRA